MMSDKQARTDRYAQAVVQAMLERWDAALTGAVQALEKDATLADRLQSGEVDADQKRASLHAALGSEAPAEVANLILVMAQEGDLELLPDVARALVENMSGQKAPVKAEVVSAVELGDDDKAQMRRKLAAQYGEGLVFSFRVDPSLMGGLRVRVGDHLIDTSVASRLATLRESLSSAVR